MARRRRRLFARWYPSAAAPLEERGLGEQRARLLAPLSGRVLELGCGFGANFEHYPQAVTELVAVEPEPHFRELSQRRAAELRWNVAVVAGTAESLPVESGSFDAVVATAVLCSVGDQAKALAEVDRVLRPGGTLVCFEHVGSANRAARFGEQIVDAVLWTHLNGGCHLSRNTLDAIAKAGFATDRMRIERFGFLPFPTRFSPHLVGAAVKPG
ncbi:MAG TPA: methyltransferase domain-containing protein [Glycomyces sp.]|nr:methyltransferase domain-containing protein [Glycomyces sp.]